MIPHTALEELPAVLGELGLRVVALDGWLTAQGNYLWTDPVTHVGSYDGSPSSYMVHHTAGMAATPIVQTSEGEWSKANAWIGLERGDRLYSSGEGLPAIYLTAAGPARVSSGYGYWPALEMAMADGVRAPWSAEGPDGNSAANRYAFNVETVHPGDGTPLHPGVLEHVIGLGVALHRMFGWDERTLGHRSWTRRKIDPYWDADPACIITIQDRIALELEEDEMDFAKWAQGLVETWAEDPVKAEDEFMRLSAEGLLGGDVGYWVALLEDPDDPEWVGMVGRTILSSWHRPD